MATTKRSANYYAWSLGVALPMKKGTYYTGNSNLESDILCGSRPSWTIQVFHPILIILFVAI